VKSAIPTIITHPRILVREGLRQILTRTRFRTTHTATDLDDISSQITDTEKCLWLMGLDKFSPTTFDNLARIRASYPELKIVVLAECDTDRNVWQALEAGVSGFLDHDISLERLVTSLELMVLGETVVPARFLHAIRGHLSREQMAHAPHALIAPTSTAANKARCFINGDVNGDVAGIARRLSGREVAILRLLMAGASNKGIANQLDITEATVKVHNKAILRKIRVQNRTQAAVWAHNHLDPSRSGAAMATPIAM
jgi:two-component system nitrate/nitrite response regulator NarL